MNLVIVESPTKAKTISKFLGKQFKVLSSFGHIRDLPKSKMGVDIEHDFTPQYIVPTDKKKIVTELKKEASKASKVILASDEDREGEAIAWHLSEALNLSPAKTERIVFHEITKEAIEEALEHPRQILSHLVDAQQARRILDRLVGYELSPFLWKKVARGLSAGRVQSVAVRLIVEREEEIKNFKQQEYWTIKGLFETADTSLPTLKTFLQERSGKKLDKFALKDKTAAETVVKDLGQGDGTVAALARKDSKRYPLPPFTTASLQQEANRRLGFSAKQTMMLAQQLYETGLITYMRTDSVNLAQKFVGEAGDYIKKTFGAPYGLTKGRSFINKGKLAQEAHEAIRPTDANREPETVSREMDSNQVKLYDLIWRRAVASQMAEAKVATTTIDVAAKGAKDSYLFRANGLTVQFDGYLKVWPSDTKDVVLPETKEREVLPLKEVLPEQHFTEPLARYSDASLVKAMEKYGIGRPSTYAPTIATIQDRGYVERIDNRRFKPTDIGVVVTNLLKEHFPNIVDFDFTAKMEQDFDHIALGKENWVPVIKNFFGPFKKNLDEKIVSVDKKAITEEKTDEVCEKCGKPMVIKIGRFGRFLACTDYPDCKNTKQLGVDNKPLPPETTDEKCEACGASMQVKRGRFGLFLSCSRYPDCKTIKKIEKKTGVSCPKCAKGDIVQKRSKKGRTFFACNKYPNCDFALWSKPTGEKCPICSSLMVFGVNETTVCSNKECKGVDKS